jgi:hypothetical protein
MLNYSSIDEIIQDNNEIKSINILNHYGVQGELLDEMYDIEVVYKDNSKSMYRWRGFNMGWTLIEPHVPDHATQTGMYDRGDC